MASTALLAPRKSFTATSLFSFFLSAENSQGTKVLPNTSHFSVCQLQPDAPLTEGEVCISWSISRAALEQMTMHLKNHTNFAIHSRPIQSKTSKICANVDQFGTY
jgi:hypothetical protein